MSSSDLMAFVYNNWLAIAIFIIGIIFSYLISTHYYKKKTKVCCYGIKSTNIIENLDSKFDNVEIYHTKAGCQPEKIKNLTVTRILFWNEGKDTIYKSDITKTPLQIKIKGVYKILDAKTIYVKTEENIFTVDPVGDGSYIVNFDYVDEKEGAVIQILHTGNSSNDIKFDGKLKGCRFIYRRLMLLETVIVAPLEFPFLKSKKIKFEFIQEFLNLMVIVLTISTLNDYLTNKNVIDDLIVIIVIILLVVLKYLYSKRRPPKGFEIFGEDI